MQMTLQLSPLFPQQLFNIEGNPVKRTPWEYPYSYDRFCTWKRDPEKSTHSVYSDRMYQWDWEKFNEACETVWGNDGQWFYNRTPGEIQRFLSLYWGHDVVLTGIEQCCNVSNGFPAWIFYYYDKEA